MKKITLILTAVLLTGLTGCVNSDYYEAPDLSGELLRYLLRKQFLK